MSKFTPGYICYSLRGMIILFIHLLIIIQCNGKPDFEEYGKEKPPILAENFTYEEFLSSYNYKNNYRILPKDTNRTTLAYLTTWNSRGYNVSKTFAPKFSYLSPFWLKLNAEAYFRIEGSKYVDAKWMSDVRQLNPRIKFVPHMIFEGSPGIYYFRKKDSRIKCSNSIFEYIQKYDLDGIVLEIWTKYIDESEESLTSFIKVLYKILHNAGKVLILLIPSPIKKRNFPVKFRRIHFNSIVDHVDYVSPTTYDYSNPLSPGANGPIKWIRECILSLVPEYKDKELVQYRRAKILIGLGVHGHDYVPSNLTGRQIDGEQFVNLVRQYHSKFKWDAEAAEHYIEYTDRKWKSHQLFFPTVYSISQRLSLLYELGTGVAIWEIGRGLDSFYDQF